MAQKNWDKLSRIEKYDRYWTCECNHDNTDHNTYCADCNEPREPKEVATHGD